MISINSFRSVETALLSRTFRPFLMESPYGAIVGRSIDREGCAIFSAVARLNLAGSFHPGLAPYALWPSTRKAIFSWLAKSCGPWVSGGG